MSHFSDRVLDAIELTLEERAELEARRAAAEESLCLECRYPDRPEGRDEEIEIHLIEPRTWRCIAIRRTWRSAQRLIEELARPVVRRRFVENAKPCPIHPLPDRTE
ncbi:MAG: hypothetical protein ACRD3Q_20800 [Terriglobales bacterium]